MPETNTQGETHLEADEKNDHLRVEASIELPPGAEVQITIQYRQSAESPSQKQVVTLVGSDVTTHKMLQIDLKKIPVQFHLTDSFRWIRSIDIYQTITPALLLAAAVLVYFLVRLIRLSDFPIFFFTDEAVHTILAADLVRDGFKGIGGEFLPTFFKSGSTFNAGFPVYLQVIPVLMGLRSVFVTRFVSVTVTLLAAIGSGVIFSEVHNNRRGWLAVLVLSIIPTWLYHSRTAFETVEAVSFFAIFLMGYIKYRNGNTRWLVVSVLAAALAFYSYSPARVVMAFMGVLLLFSDLKYHWQVRHTLWLPFIVGVILLIPYFRFLYLHPGENEHHLRLLDSYWTEAQPITWKIVEFLKRYLQGLNPLYWFLPNETDLARHVLKGIGHLGWFFVPFFLPGLIIAIKQWKNPGYRLLIFALLVSPTGAAVAEIGITRAMFMVLPAALLSAIGLDFFFNWVQAKFKVKKNLDFYFFILLALANLLFLDYMLTVGPLWHSNYGMNGMQYGGQQVFGRIKEMQQRDPKVPIVLSPDWANGTDVLARFHMGDPMTLEMASLDAYIQSQKEFAENTIFIIPPDDFNKVIASGKFEPMEVVDVLFYPDHTPGFVFAHLKYNATAKLEFEREIASRKFLDGSQVKINNELATAASSRLDIGPIQSVFDGDPNTLIRTLEANPMVVEILFEKPRVYNTASFLIGGSATNIKVFALPEGAATPLLASVSVLDASSVRKITIPFPTRQAITRIRIESKTIHDIEPAHVHLWDIGLQ